VGNPPLTQAPDAGYTSGMKTAVSLPDEIFEQVERLVQRLGVSRSELYRRALEEYLARHVSDRVTLALDRLSDEIDTRADAFVSEAGRRTLDRSEW
jgi:Arc/MetJ-type ribon-helix-helix transcriptional regulator